MENIGKCHGDYLDCRIPMSVATIHASKLGIGQSTPYPCAANTIYTTLMTNVNLNIESCRPQIILVGLTGSQTPDATRNETSGNNDGLFIRDLVNAADRRGSWTRTAGRLAISLSGPLNSPSDFIGGRDTARQDFFF